MALQALLIEIIIIISNKPLIIIFKNKMFTTTNVAVKNVDCLDKINTRQHSLNSAKDKTRMFHCRK